MRRYFTGPEALRNADSPLAMQRFQELLRVFERAGASSISPAAARAGRSG